MVQLKLKPLTEQSPDITECGNRESKLPPTQLPAFSLGLEDSFTELNSTITKNLTISAELLKPVLSSVLRMVS